MAHMLGDGGGSHLVCGIMMHCVRKSICDLSLKHYVPDLPLCPYNIGGSRALGNDIGQNDVEKFGKI